MYKVEQVFSFDTSGQVQESPVHRYLHRENGCRLNVQDEGKAAVTLMLELHTYYLCRELIMHRFPEKDHARIFEWLRTPDGKEADALQPEPAIRDELDEIYEDVLSIEEYSLNRLTAYSDKSMRELMRGVRFSLAYYMKMDRHRSSRHLIRDGLNSIRFSAVELKSVPCLPHTPRLYEGMSDPKAYDEFMTILRDRGCRDLHETELLFKTIHNTIDRTYSGQSLYVKIMEKESGEEWVDIMLRQCWESSGTDQCDAEEPLVPLMELMDRLMEYCRQEPGLHYEVDRDLEEMAMDILVPSSPLLSTIRPRNDVLDSCRKPVSSVLDRYDRDMIRDCMLFARILNNILAGSLFFEQGVAHSIYPKLNPAYMLRMLDTQLFGGRVYLPGMVFVTSDRQRFDRYRKYLVSLRFEETEEWTEPGPKGAEPVFRGYSYSRILEPLEKLDVVWEETGRSRATKVKGSFSNLQRLSWMSPEEFSACDPNGFDVGTIVVTDRASKDEVIRRLRIATQMNDAGKKMVWRVAILADVFSDENGYTYMDEFQNRIIEVGINNNRQLLDTHTNGILQRTRNALDVVMDRLYQKYRVKMYDCIELMNALDTTTYLGLLEMEFIRYYNDIIDEISFMQGQSK
ncbi:MAG: hypothetical protein MJZ38_01890 [archaeon]|nr:hypothetical protein [archaeon]